MAQATKKMYRKNLGSWGETRAREFLEAQGMTCVGNNVHSPYGEIDLVMTDGDVIVFVEVKTRANARNGYPEEAITEKKIEHMNACANWYVDEHPLIGENWRVDVVSVIGRPEDGVKIRVDWWRNGF